LIRGQSFRPGALRLRVVKTERQRTVEGEVDFVKRAVEVGTRRPDVQGHGNAELRIGAARQDFADFAAPGRLLYGVVGHFAAQQGTSGTQKTNEGKEPGFGKADQENQKRIDEAAGRR